MQRAYIKLSKWFSNYVYLFICVCVYRCMCAKACMQRSEDNLCESTLCESWGLNVGCRSWQHAVYPLSHLTYFFSLKKKKKSCVIIATINFWNSYYLVAVTSCSPQASLLASVGDGTEPADFIQMESPAL